MANNKDSVRKQGSRHPRHTALADNLFITERQAIIADLYLKRNLTQREIAIQLGISQDTVSKDIRKIKKEYKTKALNSYQYYVNRELLKIDNIEREALEAWERSIGKSERVVEKSNNQGDTETVVTTDMMVGDPRFLTIMGTCVDKRAKLLGLNEPQEVIISTMEGRLSKLIKEGKVTFDMLEHDVGRDQAITFFNLAGVEVPDIIEGEIIEDDSINM